MKPNSHPPVHALTFAVAIGFTVGGVLASKVSAAANCVPPPSYLVSWWHGESNANDAVGSNIGTLKNGAGFGTGKVGQAFDFRGTEVPWQRTNTPPPIPGTNYPGSNFIVYNQYVEIANSSTLNPTGSFSIEGWIFPRQDRVQEILAKWGEPGERSYSFHTLQNGAIRFAISDAAHQNDGDYHMFDTTNGVLTINGWNHVAAVYDQTAGARRIYVNGVKAAERIDPPITVISNAARVTIGMIVGLYYFDGLIDELSFYGKALSGEEVQAIYNGDTAGKCTGPTAPVVFTPPANQTVFAGDTASFTVSAGGTAPLSYQWTFNGANIADATGATLTLTDVQLSQAGSYAVVVTNAAGATNSSDAVLIVTNRPPIVTQQPQSLSVAVGRNASFTVAAAGTLPITYQWRLNGADISGATGSSLALNNVQLADAGTYTVQVTNALGSTNSADAILTVLATNCMPTPSELVSWWRAEGDANDAVGGNAGAIRNGAGFGPGKVGEAFDFNGIDQFVAVPNTGALNPAGSFSIEGWIYPRQDGVKEIISKWGGSGERSYSFHTLQNRAIRFAISDAAHQNDGAFHMFDTTNGVLTINGWNHVAAVYDQTAGARRIYVNGVKAAERIDPPITVISNAANVNIGMIVGTYYFNGLIDELSFYGKALSEPEIQAIFNAGSAGKCTSPTAPSIFLQPVSQTAGAGASVTFSVGASGTLPITYQWRLNGADLSGATGSSLTLNDVQLADGGSYAVVVTNAVGATNSSDAVLIVTNRPPIITQQPQSISATVGWNASFTVAVTGTLPITYQWRLNGADISGATGSSLTLNNVQLPDAGTYVVLVANSIGSTNSADATLSVNPLSSTPSLLNVNFAADPPKVKVGAAATGQGINDYWNRQWAPGQPSDAVSNLKLADGTVTSAGLTVQNGSGAYGNGSPDHMYDTFVYGLDVGNVTVTFTNLPGGQYDFYVYGYDGNYQVTVEGANYGIRTNRDWPIVSPPVWEEGRQYSLFRAVTVGAGQAVTVVARPGGLEALGVISGMQIVRLGEENNAAPVIVSQPASQSAFVGAAVTFTVGARGTLPLSYQWRLNGADISGATGISLTLTNVQFAEAGTYVVAVSNAAGSTTSSNAVLALNSPPATVRVASLDASAAGPLSVPIQLIANGDEHALGFSLTYAPELLSYTGASLGSGAVGTTLILNTNSAASGKLGFMIAQPTGMTFAMGTQEVVLVHFVTAMVTNTTSTPIIFGDEPTSRQLSDPLSSALPGAYVGGTVSVAAANFEADISPQLGGDKEVTTVDWVMVGRYVAGLGYPTNAGDFQRADCAPLDNLGDGSLNVTDWVQAGRYAAGLDPVTLSGGPTSSVAGGRILPNGLAQRASANPGNRRVRATNAILTQGQTCTVGVSLEAQGDENALGLSLSFDSAVLEYVSTSLGTAAAGAALNLNTNQIRLGKLGVVLALPPGASFPAGTREVLKVNLRTASPASGNYPVAFSDQPVLCGVSDSLAGELATAYVSGTVVINPMLTLSISQLGQNIALSWPLWATNFVLQATEGDLTPTGGWTNLSATVDTNNESCRVTLPVSGETKFYRLSLP